MRRNPRAGFTLIELLVVIGIVAILAALLIPAVQRVRHAAARVQCGNNIKNIVLAWHDYYSIHKHFPTGGHWYDVPITYDSKGHPRTGTYQAVGWAYQILPYIEQDPLYRMQDTSSLYTAPGPVAQAIVPLYICPGRRPAVGYTNARAPSDYAAAVPGYYEWNGVRYTVGEFLWAANDINGVVNRGGLLVNLAAIVDGTSNQIFVSEAFHHLDAYASGACSDGYLGWLSGWTPATIRMTKFPPRRDHQSSVTIDPNISYFKEGFFFGSGHAEGLNVGFGDGSVRYLLYTMDPNTWWRLGDRTDGMHVEFPE